MLKYRDMRPIIEKTILFKDESNNLAMSEEYLHKMFYNLAVHDKHQPEARAYIYEQDLAKRLPP